MLATTRSAPVHARYTHAFPAVMLDATRALRARLTTRPSFASTASVLIATASSVELVADRFSLRQERVKAFVELAQQRVVHLILVLHALHEHGVWGRKRFVAHSSAERKLLGESGARDSELLCMVRRVRRVRIIITSVVRVVRMVRVRSGPRALGDCVDTCKFANELGAPRGFC